MSILLFISHYFVNIQWAVIMLGFLFCIRLLKGGSTQSQFRVREADRKDLNRSKVGSDLAQAKLNKPKTSSPPPPPLALPGIRMTGEPHEILGVDENATEADVMKAYKDSIKRFHPDRIQGQAKEQMQFYQEASSKLNSAKEEMLKKIRSS